MRFVRSGVACSCEKCFGKSGGIWPAYYVGNTSRTREESLALTKLLLGRWRDLRTRRGRKITREGTARAMRSIRFKIGAWRLSLSFECYLDVTAPPDFRDGPRVRYFHTMEAERRGQEGQMIGEGLSVRERGKKSIFAPMVLRGRCEMCEGLCSKRGSYCLRCATIVRAELRKFGWLEKMIDDYLAGKDPGELVKAAESKAA